MLRAHPGLSPKSSIVKISPRIPSLDGLRAISILMVLLAHLNGTVHFPDMGILMSFTDFGNLGVTIFFVVSGLLITGILLEEHSRAGTIDLVAFYIRRSLRIFPSYYLYVSFIVLFNNIGWIHLRPGDLKAALTYTMNYHPDRAWYLGHGWSLAVEEQFYLIWPITLLLLGPRRGLLAAGAFVIVSPFIRFGLWQFGPSIYPKRIIGGSFETTGDSIAIGCVLAGIRDWLWAKPIYRRWLRSPCFIIVPLLALAMLATGNHPRVYAFTRSAAIFCIAITVDRCIRFPSGKVGSLLNSKWSVYMGGLSYSIYVWQQPFINRNVASSLTSFPMNLVLAITFAQISHYLVEKPGLRLRQRIEARFRRLRSELKASHPGRGQPSERPDF